MLFEPGLWFLKDMKGACKKRREKKRTKQRVECLWNPVVPLHWHNKRRETNDGLNAETTWADMQRCRQKTACLSETYEFRPLRFCFAAGDWFRNSDPATPRPHGVL